jgi:hypothetical protein
MVRPNLNRTVLRGSRTLAPCNTARIAVRLLILSYSSIRIDPELAHLDDIVRSNLDTL